MGVKLGLDVILAINRLSWRVKFKTPPGGYETEIQKSSFTTLCLQGRKIRISKNFHRNFTLAPSKNHLRTHRKLPITQVQVDQIDFFFTPPVISRALSNGLPHVFKFKNLSLDGISARNPSITFSPPL